MLYQKEDVFDYIESEDVSFIRLAFCDIFGKQKNVSIMPSELAHAFDYGISFDASAVLGFGGEIKSDLLLFPIPSTLNVLPWRPSHGKVVRMFCDIKYPDGSEFVLSPRKILRDADDYAKKLGYTVRFGTEFEFYLFKTDENGERTDIPFDNATYMDVAPEDKGENVRREICLTLLDMGITPESSHHEEGPGQNEIDFKYDNAVFAADNAINFISVVKATALKNGLYADFTPKPIANKSGNGMHINMSVKANNGEYVNDCFMAGILKHIKEITRFLNPTEDSYLRLGKMKAPKYITWSKENRTGLIRIPAASEEYERIELRSPDPCANPYIAYALLIYAGIDGIINKLYPNDAVNLNLYKASKDITDYLDVLPDNLYKAKEFAKNSELIKTFLPKKFFEFI